MAFLKFTDSGLQDENGNIFLISERYLLEECLKHPFDTISISKIIFDTITRITGYEVSKACKYNKSKFYCWIERNIQQDERYLQAKEEKTKEENEMRKGKKEYEEKKKRFLNRTLDEQEREILRRYYR